MPELSQRIEVHGFGPVLVNEELGIYRTESPSERLSRCSCAATAHSIVADRGEAPWLLFLGLFDEKSRRIIILLS